MRIHSMDSSDPFNVMYILNHYIVEVDHNLRRFYVLATSESLVEKIASSATAMPQAGP